MSVAAATSADTPLLAATHLCAWYGAAQILFDVGLSVRRGEVVALMGTTVRARAPRSRR